MRRIVVIVALGLGIWSLLSVSSSTLAQQGGIKPTPRSHPTATATLPSGPTATATSPSGPTATPTRTATPAATPTSTTTATSGSQVSSDSFSTTVAGQHASEVEPDTLASNGAVVSAFQVGRFNNGGSTDVGWATLSGGSWQHGLLPGLTTNGPTPGPYDRATDPAVAYDAAHAVWLLATLGLNVSGNGSVVGAAVLVSRSSDGLSWSNPITVSSAGSSNNYDKEWIVCDDHAASPYYGHCYMEWDDNGHGDLMLMSTSSNGGLSWSSAVSPAGNPSGLGGQPLVQPNGTVVVPADNGYESAIIAYRSTDGGQSWGNLVTVTSVSSHAEGGGLRSGPLPSAEIDAAGKIYVVWGDCRFEAGCAANDIVMSTSTDGSTWSSITRIPIDTTGSGVDHFIPGIAVNPATSGTSAHLALTYYYYPNTACSSSTCQLEVGFVSSATGGSSWSSPTQLAGSSTSSTGLGPMSLSWLSSTNQGPMVGDYISTSFAASSSAVPVFAVAQAPSSGVLNEAMYSTQVAAAGGSIAATQTAARTGTTLPVLAADHAAKDRITTIR